MKKGRKKEGENGVGGRKKEGRKKFSFFLFQFLNPRMLWSSTKIGVFVCLVCCCFFFFLFF